MVIVLLSLCLIGEEEEKPKDVKVVNQTVKVKIKK
jgi:hypothetical protein